MGTGEMDTSNVDCPLPTGHRESTANISRFAIESFCFVSFSILSRHALYISCVEFHRLVSVQLASPLQMKENEHIIRFAVMQMVKSCARHTDVGSGTIFMLFHTRGLINWRNRLKCVFGR